MQSQLRDEKPSVDLSHVLQRVGSIQSRCHSAPVVKPRSVAIEKTHIGSEQRFRSCYKPDTATPEANNRVDSGNTNLLIDSIHNRVLKSA